MRSVFEIGIFACSLVGMLSAARLAVIQVRARVVSALDVTKMVTGGLLISAITLFFSRPTNLFPIWFCLQAPFAIAVFLAILLAKRRDRAVEESLDEVLSRLMMRMKEGRSLAVALDLISAQTSARIRPRWLEIARSVSFSPQENALSDPKIELKSLRLIEIARELRRINLLSRAQLSELERWRARVRTERIFRRRSVQAMAQVRAQSIILATIYVLIAGFSIGAIRLDLGSRMSATITADVFARLVSDLEWRKEHQMVDLNPVLSCLRTVEEYVIRGETVRDGVTFWLSGQRSAEPSAFRDEILVFLRDREISEARAQPSLSNRTVRTVYRESLFLIFEAGLSGQSILPSLKELRFEVEAQMELDMKAHVDALPLKMLLPLLLCMFPAFLILLLGPITRNFLEALK